MSNPWDPMPLPTKGDDSSAKTFEWVGRVLSQWVHIEFQLGMLHSAIAQRPNDGNTVREYGDAGKIFRARLLRLRQTADRFFKLKPDQCLEGEFYRICTAAAGFADRRNEVAHGVVFPSVFLPSFIEDRVQGNLESWALAPPYFEARKFDTSNFPKHVYTSRELHALVINLIALRERIEKLQASIVNVR